MVKSLKWRMSLLGFLTVWALYQIAPTIIFFAQPLEIRKDETEFKSRLWSWLPQEHLKLGLDLQGGVQLVLGVDTKTALSQKLARQSMEIKRWAEEEGYEIQAYPDKEGKKILIDTALEKEEDFQRKFLQNFPEFVPTGDAHLSYKYKEEELVKVEQSAREQAERVIRNRVDRWGVEPVINRRADGSILVQLPGFSDPQKAKDLLGQTAQLSFYIVDDQFDGFKNLGQPPLGIESQDEGHGQWTFFSEDKEQLQNYLIPHVPENRLLLFEREILAGAKGKYRWSSLVVDAQMSLSGEDVADAALVQGQTLDRRPVISLKFTGTGARRFAEVTGDNVKKRLAISLDGIVESAPVISQKIVGGQASITMGGGRSYQQIVEEGNQLALILKSGAIPAKITILNQHHVGATLGPELAHQGIKGILLGFFLVLAFMLIYYRGPGLLACITLFLNAIFLMACMAAFEFSLTLPGLAGFVLTLGMAIDANVLINERIRQELAEGKHPKKAVPYAFEKIFWTVIDANLTTLIAAVVLLETNPSGPIRGFAITLMVGLLVSIFTSLYGTHLLFDWVLSRMEDRKMKSWLGGGKHSTFRWPLLSWAKPFTVVGALLGVLSLGSVGWNGLNYGVDFVGGSEIVLSLDKDISPENLRRIAETHVDGLKVQNMEGSFRQFLLRYDEPHQNHGPEASTMESSSVFQNFKDKLMAELAEFGPRIDQAFFVGPQVSQELRMQGFWSLLYAILAVFAYVALRFEMRFAPAMLKMILDMVLLLGFYSIFDITFDLVAVAAFLTVIGYSVNDTIVIFDRIRENVVSHPKKSLWDNMDLALRETFSRSMNTALTTILSLVGILVFASGELWSFGASMVLGVVIATFTSTFVATTLVLGYETLQGKKQRQLKSL